MGQPCGHPSVLPFALPPFRVHPSGHLVMRLDGCPSELLVAHLGGCLPFACCMASAVAGPSLLFCFPASAEAIGSGLHWPVGSPVWATGRPWATGRHFIFFPTGVRLPVGQLVTCRASVRLCGSCSCLVCSLPSPCGVGVSSSLSLLAAGLCGRPPAVVVANLALWGPVSVPRAWQVAGRLDMVVFCCLPLFPWRWPIPWVSSGCVGSSLR